MLCIVHSTLPPPFLGDSAKMHESSEDFFSFFHSRSRRRGQQPEEEMKPPPRLTSAEKRAKRRLGYEPPLMVRRNSFVDKLDKKDPEDKGRNWVKFEHFSTRVRIARAEFQLGKTRVRTTRAEFHLGNDMEQSFVSTVLYCMVYALLKYADFHLKEPWREGQL
jgi:hypothetical protein